MQEEPAGWRQKLGNFVTILRGLRGGFNHSSNIVAQLSSVSIFAFVDKEGIMTETQKFIDEVAVLSSKQQKVVIDLSHEA